ncbi:hypothetical protein [Halobacteriovorax sp. ZH4_bin.1]|uniref:hypothetical protein n=1 Tax=unclassified Halobacteriovorax TaxID=2639665 RepID=UPI003722F167
MKALIILSLSVLTFVSAHFTYAQDVKPNVVLLTSLETPRIWYKPKGWKIDPKLEKIFKKHFDKSGYNIVVKHSVDFHELRRQLHNPNNIAVFWASHAAGTSQNTTGSNNMGAVLSINGKDVKDLFKSVHPNIRYLGLVGCDAEGILNEISREGHYRYNPNLITHSFTKKIDARKGLKKSLKASVGQLGYTKKRLFFLRKKSLIFRHDFYGREDLLKVNNYFHCAKENGYLVKGVRTLTQDSMEVAITNSQGILKILPAAKAGDRQEFQFYLPYHPEFARRDMKINVDSLIYFGEERKYLGEFEFETDWGTDWRVFAKPDGTVLGVTKNLYLPRGSLPSIDDVQTYKELSCNDTEEMKVHVY